MFALGSTGTGLVAYVNLSPFLKDVSIPSSFRAYPNLMSAVTLSSEILFRNRLTSSLAIERGRSLIVIFFNFHLWCIYICGHWVFVIEPDSFVSQ